MGLAVLFGGSLWIVVQIYINEMNERRLQELLQTAIVRMERQIDLAVIGMGELVATGPFDCSVEDRKAMEQVAFLSASIREIRVDSANGGCWGHDGRDEVFGSSLTTSPVLPATNPAYELATLKLANWQGLMVRWKRDNGSITALLASSGMLFDLLSSELRDHASLELSLQDGRIFSQYLPESGAQAVGDDPVQFGAASDRYPIQVELRINSDTFSTWNRIPEPAILGFAALMSGVFGFLSARGLVRPASRLDEMDEALAKGHIQPHFQPLFSLEDNHVTGFEMLARWIKPDGTSVSPAVFIPLAEEQDRIDPLVFSLLAQAGRQVGDLLKADADLKMSFNITPDQLLSDGFVERLTKQIDASGLPHHCLVLEITERQPIADVEKALMVSGRLAELGLRIAIDDAGTGHNGLSSLHALQANYLKIDKYFIDGVTLNRKSFVLVETLVSLAEQFGMTVIAEGIENADQLAKLQQLGIREGQGFIFSRPLPADELLSMMKQSQRQPMKAA